MLDASKMEEKGRRVPLPDRVAPPEAPGRQHAQTVRIVHSGTTKIVSSRPQNSDPARPAHDDLRPAWCPAPRWRCTHDSISPASTTSTSSPRTSTCCPSALLRAPRPTDDGAGEERQEARRAYEILGKYPDPTDLAWEVDLAPYEYLPTDENADLAIATERLDYVPEVSNETKLRRQGQASLGLGWYGERLRA